MLTTWLWVLTGAAGSIFAAMVLREDSRDWAAARSGGWRISPASRLFLRETLRTTWYRLLILLLFTSAGLIPALIPLPVRPFWVRQLTVVLLIVGEVLLTADTWLRYRAKRRLLRQFNRETRTGPPADPPASPAPEQEPERGTGPEHERD